MGHYGVGIILVVCKAMMFSRTSFRGTSKISIFSGYIFRANNKETSHIKRQGIPVKRGSNTFASYDHILVEKRRVKS